MRLFLSAGLMVLLLSAQAQRVEISGRLLDEKREALVGATVSLLRTTDSVMVAFAVANAEGYFRLEKAPKGDYLLLASFIGYHPHAQKIEVAENTPTPLLVGEILMQPDQKMLSEVVVDADRIPIRLKQDTIEYDANAFATQANATVEDLLKKLPGVEVDRDGTVKAQGETVQKVLVDGKEFFGNDPKMATKNLPADAVDKVQVFKKKSEFAAFAGIDDGNEEQTINLSLKEDKKDGLFGKVTGGYGPDNRFLGKASINQFKPGSQLSYIGNYNNLNQLGFTFSDYLNFSGGAGMMSSGGNINIQTGNIPISDGGMRDGYITSTASGLNFNKDLNEKAELRSSYTLTTAWSDLLRETDRTNFLEDGSSFDTRAVSESAQQNFNHRLNALLKYKLNPANEFTFQTTASLITRRSDQMDENSTSRADTVTNSSTGISESQGRDYSVDLAAGYRKKFNKAGRTFSTEVKTTVGDATETSVIGNESRIGINTFALRQDQEGDNQALNYTGTLGYTEPMSPHSYLHLQYEQRNFNNEVVQNYFDLIQNDRELNTALSTAYTRDYRYHLATSTYHFNRKKLKWSTGLAYQTSQLTGDILTQEVQVRNTFRQWLPRATFNYEMGTGKRLNFTYRTSLNEPALNQLQPTVNNRNPLQLYVGNPNLGAEYRHVGNLSLHWFDQFSFTNFFAYLNSTYTLNKIITATTINENLAQVSSPINSDYDLLVNGSWSFGMPFKPLGIKYNIRQNVTYNQGFVFLNGTESTADRWSNAFTLTLENRKKKVIDVAIGSKLALNSVTYSENSTFDQQYNNWNHFVDLTVKLGEKWVWKNTLDVYRYQNELFTSQPNRTLWQMEISRLMLKENRGELKLIAFDLLNQNLGISQTSSINYVQEERIQTLSRYFLLSFTYSLQQFQGPAIHFQNQR